MAAESVDPFAAALLAGGQSRRMGTDKALLPVIWQGQQMPLWKRQLTVLEELKPSQLFLSGPPRAGLPIVSIRDRWQDAGPLAGIATCLDYCSPEFLLVLAVDLASMSSNCLRRLLLCSGRGCGIVPVRQALYEPLAAVYPKQALSIALARLERSKLKLQEFVRELVAAGLVRPWQVPPEMDDQFLNWNSPVTRGLDESGPSARPPGTRDGTA
jgi:molybdopterin-guanine dinucleotide biosynthesis protein A